VPILARLIYLVSTATASIWTVEISTFLGYERLSPDATHITTLTRIGSSVFGIMTICTDWLTFFPPAWYRARFRSPDGSEVSF
jgi:hypothetical protein